MLLLPKLNTLIMRTKLISIVVLIAIAVLPIISLGQTAPFPDDGGTPCDGPFGPVCPIDGGASFLIAAGIALGGKKAYKLIKKD
ncbi:MAG: hypothetical protein ACJAU0_000342 [Flavobacteriales bacterium]